VQQRGSATVSELAAEFGCSKMTIRRDLDALGRDGVVRRMHGSAVTASLWADEKPEVAFERLRFDTFVLGACGIDARHGVTTHLPADARVKRAAVASSARTIVVADRSKLGVVTFGHVCPLSAAERLLTDASPGDTADLEGPGFIVQRV
jgi:DeoR/GlpR family transcriptional regulator of sugar metabolism